MNSHIEEERFDPKRPILPNWRIASSGQHFYRYGFSLQRNDSIRRSKTHHPVLVFNLTLAVNLKTWYCVFTPQRSEYYHLLIGDIGYFFGARFHLNLCMATLWLMALLSQAIHLYYYLRLKDINE